MLKCGKGDFFYSCTDSLIFFFFFLLIKSIHKGETTDVIVPSPQCFQLRIYYLILDNWKRIFKILLCVNMLFACILLLGVLNTSGVKAAPGTLKHAVWVGTVTLKICQFVMAFGNRQF